MPRRSGFSLHRAPSFKPRSNPGRCHGIQPISSPKISRVSRSPSAAAAIAITASGLHVVDVTLGEEGMQRRVDARCPRVQPTPGTGFGMHWFDYDLDGFLDLVVANGAVTIVESQRGQPYPFRQRNQLFHREGPRFRDVTAEAGPAFEPEEVSRGAAFGDIDNDGDVDILLANNNGPARLLLNRAGDANSSLRLRLEGTASNRDAAGARVSLLADGKPARTRRVGTDGSYLSASEPIVTFGLGADSSARDIGVVWPNGTREMFAGLSPGEARTIEEGRGEPWAR